MSRYQLTSSLNIDDGTLKAALRHRSFDAMSGILGWIFNLVEKEYPDFTVAGSDLLEIGTGKFLNHPLGMIVCGCREMVTIDTERQLQLDAVRVAMENSILARRSLSSQCSHDMFMLKTEQLADTHYTLDKLKKLGLTYVAPFSYSDRENYIKRFDAVFSYTVLEHVDPDEISEFLDFSIASLKDGGHFFHFVDLEDHKHSFEKPFEFLRKGREWSRLDSAQRGNRLRFSSWKKIFSKRDDILYSFPYRAVRNDVEMPDDMDSIIDYISEEDLRTTAFLIVGKKVQ